MLLLLNYQNRQRSFLSNLLSINIPILISQAITYPLLKLQTQLLSNNSPITIKSIRYHLKYLLEKEKYPKILQGIRYSLDHSITYATLRFFILDWMVIGLEKMEMMSLTSILPIVGSTMVATLIGQPSLVQRTVASSLPQMDIETLTTKMKSLDFKKVATVGLKYSLFINLLSTSLDLCYLYFFRGMIQESVTTQSIGGVCATLMISALIHPLHYLRVSQINQKILNINQSIDFRRAFDGIETSVLRRGINNSILFTIYLWYNFHSAQQDHQSSFQSNQKRETYSYRQGTQKNKVKSIFSFD